MVALRAQLLNTVVALCLAAACAPATQPSQADIPQPTSAPTAAPTQPAAPGAADAAIRQALLSELANDVQARRAAEAQLLAARTGDLVAAGGLVRTGQESKVRLDFTEGTIVRLGANSEFAVAELSPNPADPFTRLSLFAGQVWVILNGGQLEVETPVGVAAVRGSYLGVWFDPQSQRLIVTCLEGRCSLTDPAGVRVELVDGQMSEITGPGHPPAPPGSLSAAHLAEWVRANPEAQAMVAQVYPQGTPTPGPEGPQSGGIGGGGAVPGAGGAIAGGGAVAGGAVNTTPLRYDIRNTCTESRTVTYTGPESGGFTLAPGESRGGELPPGTYTFQEPGGSAVTWNSADGPLVGAFCDEPAPGGGGGSRPGTPAPIVNTQPLRYTLVHNCPVDPQTGAVREGVWEWTLQNLTTGDAYSLSLGPGESLSGELPPGHYRVSDRDATGPLASGEIDSDAGGINVTRCRG